MSLENRAIEKRKEGQSRQGRKRDIEKELRDKKEVERGKGKEKGEKEGGK